MINKEVEVLEEIRFCVFLTQFYNEQNEKRNKKNEIKVDGTYYSHWGRYVVLDSFWNNET